MTSDSPELSHLDDRGEARMVDVEKKPVTKRMATASCVVIMSTETAGRLAAADLPKGDARSAARIAGIQAAKRTHELIPLCHPLSLTSIDVRIDIDAGSGRAHVRSEVVAMDRTGVEMEALVAASTAALTIYDMVKAVERGVSISELRLDSKTGGTRGDWTRESA